MGGWVAWNRTACLWCRHGPKMARGFHHALLRDQPVQTLVSAKRTQGLRRRCSQSSWGLARAVGQRRRRLAQRACPRPSLHAPAVIDRKSVGSGKSVSVRVDLGGRRIIKKKKNNAKEKT